ncbi:MAG: sensor histidine kinase [Pseudomonadota bacterium]|jgi:signal transduction histidine kinase
MNAGLISADSAETHWLSSRTAFVLAVILSISTFVFDIIAPPYMALSVMPYFLVVAISAWMRPRLAPFYWFALCSALALVGVIIKAPETPGLMFMNRLVTISLLFIVSLLAFLRQRSEAQLLQTNERLGQEVANRTQELEHSNKQLHASLQELQLAKASADAGNNAKRRFLAQMSHELRTPLNAVLGFSDAMRQQILGPLGNSNYLLYSNAIHESGGALLNMLESILVASQLESAEYTLREENVDIRPLINEVVAAETGEANAKQLNWRIEIQPGLPLLRADRAAVRRMLASLLSNAVKFSPDRAVLQVLVKADQDGISIEIHDQGEGIAPQDLELFLQPFETGYGAETAGKGGAGLGLSISLGLARLHDAMLKLERGNPDGTIAILAFPPERSIEARHSGNVLN